MSDDLDRYLIIDGRRWRKSDPSIPSSLHSELVAELMSARRAVGAAKKMNDAAAERSARNRVQDSKVALGERGRAWWLPMEESDTRIRLAATIRTLLRKREPPKTMCPSEAARVCGGSQWRELMDSARSVAQQLVKEGWLEVTQRGEVAQPPIKGPIRLRRRIN